MSDGQNYRQSNTLQSSYPQIGIQHAVVDPIPSQFVVKVVTSTILIIVILHTVLRGIQKGQN